MEIAASLDRVVVRTKAGDVKWSSASDVRDARNDDAKAAALIHAVAEPAPAEAVAAGMLELCALSASGDIWCWATRGVKGPTESAEGAAEDDSVEGNKPIRRGTGTAVTVGFGHACSLQADHTLRCWGHGVAGAPWCWGGGLSGSGSKTPEKARLAP